MFKRTLIFRPIRTRSLPIAPLLAVLVMACTPITAVVKTPQPEGTFVAWLPISAASPIPPILTPTPYDRFDFTNLIADLERNAPGPASEGFRKPDQTAIYAFHTLALSVLYDESAPALDIASKYGYELLSLFDLGDGNSESYVLREPPPIERGWGLYLIRKEEARNIVVEAPHLLADVNTPTIALELYRALHAKALLVAGAHRNSNADGSADTAHSSNTIFQAMHTALFAPAGQPMENTVFLQIHGYSEADHPGYPQVVIGYNWQDNPENDRLLGQILSALLQQGITTGVCEGKRFQGLCGTSNVQRQGMPGGIFLHLELSWSLRQDAQGFVEALRRALNP